MSEQQHYRPDVDGLRAVAIALVIAFHAFPSLVPGGFIGVDVFFVISGYLISNYIVGGLRSGHFSFLTFYIRRVRRIVPALSLVMLVVLGFGWFVLLPSEFRRLGKHVVASATFCPNIVFWLESGYFDTDAATKPLLHLWSLGVEEQFYLIWPGLLWGLWRLRVPLTAALIALIAASFLANVVIVGIHPTAAFFLPQTRLWEPAVGALLAIAGRERAHGAIVSELKGIAGFALIAAGVILIDPAREFPGWWALLPVAGTGLLISAGPGSWLTRRILGNRLLVAVGLISYPLYLWHWPLLSFGRILAEGTNTVEFRLAAIVAALGLAVLTYFFIENPIRHSRRRLVPAGLLASLAIVGAAVMPLVQLPNNNHALWDDPATMSLGKVMEPYNVPGCGLPAEAQARVEDCWTDKRAPHTYVVWGDSKANAIYPGLVSQSGATGRWSYMGSTGCAPVTKTMRVTHIGDDDLQACAEGNETILRGITRNKEIKAVLLATAARVLVGPSYAKSLDGAPYDNAVIEGLIHSVQTLHDAGKDVFFLLDNPTLPDPKDCVERIISLRAIERKPCHISIADHLKATAKYRALVSVLRQKLPYVVFIDPVPLLCDVRSGICPIQIGGRFLYSYGDHMSDTGNERVGRAIVNTIEHRSGE